VVDTNEINVVVVSTTTKKEGTPTKQENNNVVMDAGWDANGKCAVDSKTEEKQVKHNDNNNQDNNKNNDNDNGQGVTEAGADPSTSKDLDKQRKSVIWPVFQQRMS